MLMMVVVASGFGAARWYRARNRRRALARCEAVSAHDVVRSTYVPFVREDDAESSKCIVVDCTHPSAVTLTHHKAHNNVPSVAPSDTSTGLVLNAVAISPEHQSPDLKQALQMPHISCNHFDVDAILSVWSWINRDEALRHEAVLRAAARIGDFREVLLPRLYPDAHAPPAEAAADGVAHDEATVLRALRLCCWLNSQEKALFSAPYECKDGDAKFEHFLAALGPALERLPPEELWHAEFDEVMAGIEAVERSGSVTRRPELGLAVVRAPRPLHYYALFSFSAGADVVASVYPGGRYELEAKYSQFVALHSRPVHPRLDFAPLAQALNELEGGGTRLRWQAARMTDTGPVLRLEDPLLPLSKAQRYGHPAERPIHASSIPPHVFERTVASFFAHGLRGTAPRAGGWEWPQLHRLNKRIDWDAWARPAAAGAPAA